MNKILFLAGLSVLAGMAVPAQCDDLSIPESKARNTPEIANSRAEPPHHARDMKHNQFHERGRDQHNRAEEIVRQATTQPRQSRVPPAEGR